MKLGTETGSLVNHIYSRVENDLTHVRVGDGVTICGWTDRHPATVVKVTKSQVHVKQDIAVRTDKNGLSEVQEYSYQPNPEARVEVFRLGKRGLRNPCGNSLVLGRREKYHDFSF